MSSQPGRHRHKRQQPRPGEPVVSPLVTESRNGDEPGRQQDPATAVPRFADRYESPDEREERTHH